MRLDLAIAERGLAKSRTTANELIACGAVLVDGEVVLKQSFNVSKDSIISVTTDDWVGRGGKKLTAFLQEIAFNVLGKECLDVGASVGGFTQALLKKGALSVTALDVGKNQLHDTLIRNKKVINACEMDVRDFNYKEFDLVVCDLSFISLDKVLDDLLRLAKLDIITLFKPQFEVGRLAKRTKKGVVLEDDVIALSIKNFEELLLSKNLKIISSMQCVLAGKEGNIERFYHFTK